MPPGVPPRIFPIFALIFGLLASAIAGCDRAPSAPAQSADPSVRLAVLSPALAQTLRDLGLGEQIVARHGWDSISPQTIPPVGGETGLDYEALLRARPTHVILQASAQGVPPRLAQLATEQHWKVTSIPLLKLDDVRAGIAGVWAAAGRVDEPPAQVLADFDRALQPRPALKSRLGRVLILAGTDPPGAMGPGSFHFELVERLGGSCVPNTGAAYIQLSPEDVLKLDPDTLVLLAPGALRQFGPAGLTALLGPLNKLGLRCVRDNRLIVVSDPACQLPATTLARVADTIARQAAAWDAPPAQGPGGTP